MRSLIASFAAGTLFGIGLGVAGMTMPSKVIGFLDLFGSWDASLALVMVGAIVVHFLAYRWVVGYRSPLFSSRFHLPTRKDIDVRLVLGAAIFGIGWGLVGYCPGPALVGMASGLPSAAIFVTAMAAGMVLERGVSRALASRPHVAREPS